MKTFRIYYENGNQKLFDAPCKKDMREYLMEHIDETGAVRKIEEVEEDNSWLSGYGTDLEEAWKELG